MNTHFQRISPALRWTIRFVLARAGTSLSQNRFARFKRIHLFAVPILLIALVTTALLVTRAHHEPALTKPDANTQSGKVTAARNISLQPEPFKMSRRLGRRFSALSRAAFLLAGILTTQEGQQPVSIIRRQTDTGETVEIISAARRLRWSSRDGITALSGPPPTQVERLLVERFALDSPDQFILAQLRGASYQIVARNARPIEIGGSENYTGPVWDMVRVTDPERDAQKRLVSRSRVYYINGNTGLIDKIVCEISDDRIEAFLSEWNVVSGEQVPTRIVWKHEAQTLMQFTLSTFTPVAEQ